MNLLMIFTSVSFVFKVLKEYEKVQPNTLPDEVGENPSLSYKVALIEAQNQLVDLQSQLNTQHGEVKELKEAKMSLEKRLEAANVFIQKLGVDRAF